MINYTDMGLGISLAALLVCLTNLVFTLVNKRYDKPQNKVFIMLLCILIVNAACGMVSTFTDRSKYTSDNVYIVLQASRYVYFLTHSMIAPLFFAYISFVTGYSFRKSGKSGWKGYVLDHYLHIIAITNEIIIALNPLTDWIYYFTDDRKFHREWGEFVFAYGPAAIWMLAAFIILMKSMSVVSVERRYAMIFCYSLALAGVLLQLIFSKFRIEVLMEAVGFTGILIFVENEDDRMDVTSGVYNSSAFKLDLKAAIRNRIPTEVILVRDISGEEHQTAAADGSDSSPERAVAQYLCELVGKYYVYSIGRGKVVAVIYNDTGEYAGEIAEKTYRFIGSGRENGKESVRLNGRVLLLDVPEIAASAEDVLDIADFPIPESADSSFMSGSELDWIVRRGAVESAVKRCIKDGSFEVWYQPVFTIDRRLHGAEALVRMNDSELGRVFPDEFISVAERMGVIGDIDELVFRKVCALLATGEPQSCGIECINVNLSVVECMRSGFADRFISIADEAGISGSNVVFEITETFAAEDIKRMTAVIAKLGSRGFTFAIDDFGTGYSNLSAILSLGADVIKIDKSVLWSTDKDESRRGRELLAASLKMIKAMGKKSVAEGVELEQHISLLEELGCNYLQGYLFSKPLPKNEFLLFIKEHHK